MKDTFWQAKYLFRSVGNRKVSSSTERVFCFIYVLPKKMDSSLNWVMIFLFSNGLFSFLSFALFFLYLFAIKS